jgi:hypothetical protein
MSKNKPANRTTSANKPAPVAGKKIVAMGKAAATVDVAALEARLAAAEAALAQSEADKAALQAKVKTSARREVKAPEAYNVLQPVYVALRGNINKDIVNNDTILDIFAFAAKALQITVDIPLQKRLHENTVLHNSTSNLAKAKDKAGIVARLEAYEAMTEQARIMLPDIADVAWKAYRDTVQEYADKAAANLKY